MAYVGTSHTPSCPYQAHAATIAAARELALRMARTNLGRRRPGSEIRHAHSRSVRDIDRRVNRTRIERRWSETTRIALIGGGCLASGAWLATTPWAFFAIMPLALGVGSLLQARATGEAACPGCGGTLDELRLGDNDGILCRGCRRFIEGKGGEIWLTDENRVASKPIFGAEMPSARRPEFPPFCPACMAPSVRTLRVGVDVPRSRYRSEHYSYDVPACAQHGDGVRIVVRAPFQLAFRSYAYQRAFCEANRVAPAQLA